MGLMQRVKGLSKPVDLTGRTAMVVGATAGIGEAAARQLSERGATMILVGRDAAKLQRSAASLAGVAPGRLHIYLADLADLSSVERAARTIAGDHDRIDIVIANASVIAQGGDIAAAGRDRTFAVNHYGNAAFLLGLEAPIRAAAGRVVIVASEAHRRASRTRLLALLGDQPAAGRPPYAESKLANILFARALASRWPAVTIYAAHPGGVNTAMLRDAAASHWVSRLLLLLFRPLLLEPDEAASGLLRVAADPDLAEPSGSYFELGRPDRPGRLAEDAALQDRLWAETLRVLGRSAEQSGGEGR